MIFYFTIFRRLKIFFNFIKYMLKSQLFLLCSLGMLLLFASNNIYSPAVGIKDDLFQVYIKYKDILAKEYEKDYHSLSSSASLSYSNESSNKLKNNDVEKKIKCNNRSNLNELDNIPDINNPLDVKVVTLEGNKELSKYSVRNNEINNANYDIDCTIYSNKNVGDERERSLNGSESPNLFNLTNIYVNPGNLNDTSTDGVATSIATCNKGDTVLSGSYFISYPYTEKISVPSDIILDSALPAHNGWKTEAFESDLDGIITIQTFAKCIDNPNNF